jgi:hypothetical protein
VRRAPAHAAGCKADYVFNLPAGPIWLLHAFYLVTTGLMLVWYLRYEWQPSRHSWRPAARAQGIPR